MDFITRFGRMLAASLLLGVLPGCYGWEYPKRAEILRVEQTSAVARLSISELSDSGDRYLGSVIEVHGIIRHVVNKGGQPAVSLSDEENIRGLLLTFGPHEKQAVGKLILGSEASFKGLVVKIPSYSYPGELRPTVADK